jgi:Tol biopolymer transport system component
VPIIPAVPSDLEKLILRCVRKDPQRRYQHIADVKVALQDIKEESESGPAAAVVPRSRRSLGLAAAAGTLILVAGLGWWFLRSPHQTEAAALRVVPLTTLKGREFFPTFSPDAQQVAFTWNGEREDNFDIYLTMVGSSEVRRLTSDPAEDVEPRWSPNGQEIAFLRVGTDRTTLHVVSPLGGSDRKVSDLAVEGALDWSPDGHWIAAGHEPGMPANPADVGGIYLVPLDGGEPRLLIQSQPPASNFAPTFAPDGRRLAYLSCDPSCGVYVVDVDTAYKPLAAPRQLVPRIGLGINSIAWARDGRSVIFGGGATFLNYLWRVPADGSRAPERIEVAGLGAAWPATVFSRDRLAFSRDSGDEDLYRFVAGRPPEVVAASSFLEMEAALSADGRRLAFTSTRSADALQIWVSGADGSDPQQLTRGANMRGSPSWSPDARHLAFDSFDDDRHYHIWIMDADGANRRQVTADPGDQNVPRWSRDGQWIYFSWGQGNQRDVWRMHPTGGLKERVTRGGSGHMSEESADGTRVLYQQKEYADGPLLALPLNGGAPQQLIACVSYMAFAVAATGIYYVPCFRDASDPALHLLDPDTGSDRVLGTLEHDFRGLTTVSFDGRVILYNRGRDAADLMLIENFR